MIIKKDAHPELPNKIKCSSCLADIPRSSAMALEVHDYVHYFCGLECYQQWQDREESQEIESIAT